MNNLYTEQNATNLWELKKAVDEAISIHGDADIECSIDIYRDMEDEKTQRHAGTISSKL